MSFLTKNRLKKGYMEMKNFIFLVPVKSVLGSSILYYSCGTRLWNNNALLLKHTQKLACFLKAEDKEDLGNP